MGAIPTSHLVSRSFAKIDLRQHGSGNLGATNLYRVLGWKYAIPVGLFDIAKGAIPVLVFAPQVSGSELYALACGVAAIIGHVFSVFVGFKGGKGVATAAGVMLALTPLALGVAAAVWAVVLMLTGYVSLASIAAAAVLPLAVYLLEPPDIPELLWMDVVIAAGSHRAASAEYPATAQRDREPVRAADGERSARMTLVAVLGAGSWGTTLANLLALKGDDGSDLGLRTRSRSGDQPRAPEFGFLAGRSTASRAPRVRRCPGSGRPMFP